MNVEDSRLALAKMARRYHGKPDETLKVVGITGTNGKTTVSTLTRHLLEEPGRPVGLIGTVRYHLGIGSYLHSGQHQKHLICIQC